MSPDDYAHVEAIREDPYAPGPLLVYADVLEERGDEVRAECLRLSARSAVLPTLGSERRAIEERLAVIRKEHEPRWLAAAPTFAGFRWISARRGLAESARIDVEAIRGWSRPGWGEDLRRNTPLGDVWWTDQNWDPDAIRAFLDNDAARGLWALRVGGRLTRAVDVAAFLEHLGPLRRLRFLELTGNAIGDAGAAHLAEIPGIPGLEVLLTNDVGIGDIGAIRILKAIDPARIRLLNLAGNFLEGPSWEQVGALPWGLHARVTLSRPDRTTPSWRWMKGQLGSKLVEVPDRPGPNPFPLASG